MRVLIVIANIYSASNAASGRLQKFARGLRAAGAEAFVMGATKAGEDGAGQGWLTDEYGIPYTIIAVPPSRLPYRLHRYRCLPRLFRQKVEEFLAHRDLDAVIMYGDVSYIFKPLVELCRERGIPSLMDYTEWHRFRMRLLTRMHFWDQLFYRRRVFMMLDGVIGISRFWVKIARSHGIPAIRIPALGETGKGSENLSEVQDQNEFTLTYMGPMGPRDLPFTLVEGIRLAAKKVKNVRLVVVGRIDWLPCGRRVREFVKNHPTLKDRVTFTGWVSDEEVRRRLAQTDALVLLRPDVRESRACFPTRLPEYLLTGKPVILSDVGDMSLYFQHRRNAWVLPPGDQPDKLAKALMHLNSHPQEAQAIGQAGRKTAIREFSYLTHGRRLLEFLARLRGKEPNP